MDLLGLSSRSFSEMYLSRVLCRYWRFCDAWGRNKNDKCVGKLSFNKCPFLADASILISVSLVVILFEVNSLCFFISLSGCVHLFLTFAKIIETVNGCAISRTTHHDLCHDIKVGRRRDG
jgi:hypothetical protein